MKYVLDTSAVIKCVIPETDSLKVIRLVEEYIQAIHELIAPDLFSSEVANVLMMAERTGKIRAGEALAFFHDILSASPVCYAATPLLPRAIEIALTFRQSAYDCLFVALAEREGCELVTADDKLIKAIGAAMPFVISVASLP